MAFLSSFCDDPLIHTIQAPGREDLESRSRRCSFVAFWGTGMLRQHGHDETPESAHSSSLDVTLSSSGPFVAGVILSAILPSAPRRLCVAFCNRSTEILIVVLWLVPTRGVI